MSPRDEPVYIRVTATRADLIRFLRRLERDAQFRRRFASSPWKALSDAGIEVSPREAVPSKAAVLDPTEVRNARELLEGEPEWPYIFWWWWPYMGLVRPPKRRGSSKA